MPAGAFDLGNARAWQLDNGLTLITLEERAVPVASVQALYRVGARNEDSGRTGLAHFLEHMAYRATANFPGTGVVSSIYDVGGEWHGYTWIDQTTYFETVPARDLDLALRIEADRMSGLVLAAGDVAAERGAVLTELHGYENDLASVLHDTVVATALLQHPYRNNTIGWESDVATLSHDDILDFYRRHYRPANAVVAVVGDVDVAAVRARVEQLFGSLAPLPATPPPRTVEPVQSGERRVVLDGAGSGSLFEIVYAAPAAGDNDYAAFLVLQEVLAGGSGVNFRQNDGVTRAREDSLLSVAAGGAGDLRTWYPPAEFPYLFAIAGTAPAAASQADVEQSIERAVAALRDRELTEDTLAAARAEVLEQLVFDVETTEDAAHELAFFAGLHALAQRLALPGRVASVTAADLQRIARRYLSAERRTTGWYRAGAAANSAEASAPVPAEALPADTVPVARSRRSEKSSAPAVRQLPSGLPVVVQRIPLSPAAYASILVPGTGWDFPAELEAVSPAWGYSAIGLRSLPGPGLERSLERLRAALEQARPLPGTGDSPDSPEAALASAMESAAGLAAPATVAPARAAVVAVVGDVDPRATLALVERHFSRLGVAAARPVEPMVTGADQRIRFAGPASQSQVGYVAAAPGPGAPDALAWQLALYVLTHGYEGRLGLEAINRRGLAYYIDGRYASDGARAWIGVAAGVDPPRLGAMEALLREEIRNLRERPPGAAELAEARRHLLGRELTAAQSNEEIAAELSRQWLWRGRLRQPGELARELAATTDDDVRRILPAFTRGAVVVVEIGE